MEALLKSIQACLPDLEHYAATHGPGPDIRLKNLKVALNMMDRLAGTTPKLHRRKDNKWIVLDCPGTPLWHAFFTRKSDAIRAWELQFNKSSNQTPQ